MDNLTFEEVRITGTLIEKELTTPEYYPLTVNSLMNACNQKSNRDPIVSFDEKIIETTLDSLRIKALARRVTGSDIRVAKYRQSFTEKLNLSPEETAIMCVLMLRGAQTTGEIKGRSGRMFNFESLAHVDEIINNLMERENPLIVKLPKQIGMKESRYTHLLSGLPETEKSEGQKDSLATNELNMIEELQREHNSLKIKLEDLQNQFEKFKKQFE
ncbi:MAG: YceH family protein [Ignavibacteriaceae bacterium]